MSRIFGRQGVAKENNGCSDLFLFLFLILILILILVLFLILVLLFILLSFATQEIVALSPICTDT
jgi:hypothetical protein